MKLRIYVINLDSAVERWRRISQIAANSKLQIVRVPGVDGRHILPQDRIGVDPAKFDRMNGRTMLPGEYGCYRGHLAALRQFVVDDGEAAIIMEDDVEIDANLPVRAIAVLDAAPRAEIVRLLSHRSVGFRAFFTSTLGDRVGRAMFGPQGSAACYAVRREGAQKLLQALATIKLPYDVALERGWATGIDTFSTGSNLVELGPLMADSQIASKAAYASVKKPSYRRLSTFVFRAFEMILRIIYATVK
jgi:glycosyl transferase, family 25